MQNYSKPTLLLRDFLIVVTGMRPAYGAYKVCMGKEMEEQHVVDAINELTAIKVVEIVCESVPGCVLQMFAMLKKMQQNEAIGRAEVASVVVSALTTGYSSATISYDYDTDPVKRKETPDFYGYIPDEGGVRTLLLVCMTVNSALLLLMRSFSAAMLMQVRKRYVIYYMTIDHSIYVGIKLLRGDFYYWFPIDGVMGLLVSFFIRVFAKIVVDFVGVLQFRHGYEVGGFYWTLNMFLAQLMSFVSVFIFFDSGGQGIEVGRAYTLVGSVSVTWLAVFGVFLLLMKKEFRGTFFSLKTGKQITMDFFLKSTEDESRSLVLTCNKVQWEGIREQVKEWVLQHWWRWKEEQPEWYSDAWIAKVPQDFIPQADRAEAAQVKAAERDRRRSSIFKASAAVHAE